MARPSIVSSQQESQGLGVSKSGSFSYVNTENKIIAVLSWSDYDAAVAPTVDYVRYNGIDFTFENSTSITFGGDNTYACEIWYLDAPATGSNTCTWEVSELGASGNDGMKITLLSIQDGDVGILNSAVLSVLTTSFGAIINTSDANGLLIAGSAIQGDVTAFVAELANTTREYLTSSGNLSGWVGYADSTGMIGEVIGGTFTSGSSRSATVVVEIGEAPPPAVNSSLKSSINMVLM